MVAVLSPGKSLREVFYYNENKLKCGDAVALLAENYPRPLAELNTLSKLDMLRKMAAIRPGIQVNSLHVSLNFDPSEMLSVEQLKQISRDYMEGIGFGDQPYLVYQHFDAAHPHVHILSTNIRIDGSRISFHHLGINKSEPVRKAIEIKYGLIRAGEQNKTPFYLQPVAAEQVVYGRSQAKRAIQNVLNATINQYRFSSLNELNALLGCYNVKAERGSEASRIYKNRGLVYRILDAEGIPVGVPIKASSFYSKPGLNDLEARFFLNASRKIAYKKRVRNAVDLWLLKTQQPDLEGLQKALKKEGIDLVFRQNQQGMIYGLTFIDHHLKCTFNGSDLGKQYSVNAIKLRCFANQIPKLSPTEDAAISCRPEKVNPLEKGPEAYKYNALPPENEPSAGNGESLMELLVASEQVFEPDPFDLTRKRKKRKPKRHYPPQST